MSRALLVDGQRGCISFLTPFILVTVAVKAQMHFYFIEVFFKYYCSKVAHSFLRVLGCVSSVKKEQKQICDLILD